MALQYVGGNSNSGTGATYNISLTGLTGGLASSASAGDIVIVIGGFATTANTNFDLTAQGYTELADVYADDTNDANLYVGYKIMTSTPDTSVTVPGANAAASGGAFIVQVWRGVDPTTPIDATTVTASGTNANDVNPPSITTVTPGALIISAGIATTDATPTAKTLPSGTALATKFAMQQSGTGSTRSAIAIAYTNTKTSPGAYDPSPTTGGETSANDSWAAATVALRPAVPSPYYVSNGFASATTGALTLAWPTHQAGDIAILMVESQANETALSTPAGFTQISSDVIATGTSLQVYWARATSSSMPSVVKAADSDHQYGVILLFRGARSAGNPIDAVATDVKNSASVTNTNPTITTTEDGALVLIIETKDLDATTAFASSQANSALYGLIENYDAGSTSGNGGGIAVATGLMPGAGAVGTTTTTVTSSTAALMTLSLRDNSNPDQTPSITQDTADATVFSTPTPMLQFTGTDAEGSNLTYEISIGKYGSVNTFTTTRPAAGAANPADTYIGQIGSDGTFSSIRNGAANSIGTSSTPIFADVAASTTTNQFSSIYRSIIPFDTSVIPSNAEIVGAVIRLYGNNKSNGLGSDDLHIVSTNQASTASPANADYATFGSTSFGSISYAAFSTSGYNAITLDSNGINNIVPGGISKFGARLGWDLNNSFGGVWASGLETQFGFESADYTGTSRDPELIVEYYTINNYESDTHAGFTNQDTPVDTDPFNSGDTVGYTVQSPLTSGSYYWQVRVSDPSGSGNWSNWSATRDFVVVTNHISESDLEADSIAGATALRIASGISDVEGDSIVEAEGKTVSYVSSDLVGGSVLEARGSIPFDGESDLEGDSEVEATGAIVKIGEVDPIEGDSALVAEGDILVYGESDLEAGSDMEVTGGVVKQGGTATVTGDAVVEATSEDIEYGGIGDLQADAIVDPGDPLHTHNTFSDLQSDAIVTVDTPDQTYGGIAEAEGDAVVTVEAENPVYTRIKKNELYKVYTAAGLYLGVLSNVISDLNIQQELNSAGSSVKITVGALADNYGEGTLIDYGNEVVISINDREEPNGVIYFRGEIKTYTPDYDTETVEITLFGYGAQTADYVVEGGDTLETNQNVQDGVLAWGLTGVSHGYWLEHAFPTPSGGPTKMSRMAYKLKGNTKTYGPPHSADMIGQTVTLYIWDNQTDMRAGTIGTALGFASVVITSVTEQIYTFSFSNIIELPNASTYYAGLLVSNNPESEYSTSIATTNTNPSNGGVLYRQEGASWTAKNDPWYQLYTSGGNTVVPFLSEDPSDILRAVIDDFNARGGRITYDVDSIDDTGTTVSYEFQTNTVLEAIDKILELCPDNWYYYIDQATNMIHLHERSDDADHIFAIGRDVATLEIEKSIENIANVIYFGGAGDPAFFKKYVNQTSIDNYGYRAIVVKDARVSLESTADVIANSYMAPSPAILVDLGIVDSSLNEFGYDLEEIKLGQTIIIANSGQGPSSVFDTATFDESPFDYDLANLSTIKFQVTNTNYRGDIMGMSLSTLPPNISKRIEDIYRNLRDLQNQYNPSSYDT